MPGKGQPRIGFSVIPPASILKAADMETFNKPRVFRQQKMPAVQILVCFVNGRQAINDPLSFYVFKNV